MIYKSEQGDLDLSKATRLYPAVIVNMQGEVAEMSLEWAELYGDKVKLVSYILVFDFTPLHEDVKDRVTLSYETKDELIVTMNEVAKLLQD